jgi:uncharacterized protein (TIGR02246 family)
MNRFGGLWMVALVSMLITTAAQADDAREAIESQNRALVVAMLAGNAEAVADLYTDDAVVFPPGAKLASGRSEIVAFWQGGIDAGIKDLSLETVSFESVGDLASEAGSLRIVATDGQVTEARYVVVWKRVMGVWKLHRDIWNSE